jgi:16S rRNA (cytosine1402-N4)-methyltransferase
MENIHVPVMLKEVIEFLKPQPGQKIIDCTLGGGGYTVELSKLVGDKGLVVGVDLDEVAIKNFQVRIETENIKNVVLINHSFRYLQDEIKTQGWSDNSFDGIVMDLGLSSNQLSDETRGFSFKGEAPLEMAFGQNSPRSTLDILSSYSALDLEKIFREYGEERFSRPIAQNIVAYRRHEKITTTKQLVDIILNSIPNRFRYSKIHPATRVFQALRIETNDELRSLEEFLPQAVSLLRPGGRLVVVSFHSLEDRIVKRFFRDNAELKVITKRIVIPTIEESSANPRSRSAKLRVAEKI